ncbi:uncharacterized protein BCR38DRAFT_140998 [Pseudomassariella vexata]|uniref:Uncharacterized protein n=1 Tax=Pseudomassariella vexata TaxID=1141098 RepID=A0A1Y2EBG7_9PEZI|nr:uncharacterized protein BCR38DRAFT_140998 [Pseudomassariella vexata]ORY68908.1 hypothetical protein BCR38DRAFT_140998 [Pseudomassariella vexata]
MRLLLASTIYNFDLERCQEIRNWKGKVYVPWEKKPLLFRLKPVAWVKYVHLELRLNF